MQDEMCPHCDGVDIMRNIKLGLTAEVGNVGLEYRTALILTGTEPLLADLCGTCGTVVRLRVQNTKRQWVTA
jgi:hypothetical protein